MPTIKGKISSWVRIARLQFYPMTWVAYSLGAAAASSAKFNFQAYIFGYASLFFIELATILSNEYYDFDTDRLNKNASPFTGGTRVLVEGKLKFQEVRAGIFLSIGVIVASGFWLLRTTQGVSPFSIFFLLLFGVFLGLGYTTPPLKLSYRGLAEVTVAVTHSPYVILCGYIFQGGSWNNPLPWLLSIPLFLATLAAITLAGIPDRLADQEVSKRVFTVMVGPRTAVIMAAAFVSSAAVSGLLLGHLEIIRGFPGKLIYLALPHGLILLFALFKLVQSGNYDRRIDGIMTLALSYIIWFGLVPLLSFL